MAGYILESSSSSGPLRFGGRVGGYDVPNCPNCRKELQSIIAFPSTLAKGFQGTSEMVPVVYCLRCSLSWHPFRYRILHNKIEIVECHEGETQWDDWYGEMEDQLPSVRVTHKPLPAFVEQAFAAHQHRMQWKSPTEQQIWRELGLPARQAFTGINQLLGVPFLFQRLENPTCTSCSRCMSFLLSIMNGFDPNVRIAPKEWRIQVVAYACLQCSEFCVVHSS